VKASRVGLHIARTFVAVTSAGAMGRSVREADAVAAYIWAAVYAGSSLLASACFVGLLRTLSLFFSHIHQLRCKKGDPSADKRNERKFMSQMQTTPITNGEAQLARRVPRGMTGKSRKVGRVAALAEAVSLGPFGVLHPTKRDRIHQLVQVSLVYSGVRFL
jgi:hypothetical protein